MILVLCDSFEDAADAYDVFVSFLEDTEPWSIKKTFDSSYCVETDEDLRYIFIDRRTKDWFYAFDRPDEIDLEDFEYVTYDENFMYDFGNSIWFPYVRTSKEKGGVLYDIN